MPSWPPICVRSSISTIFPAIKNRIPIGAYLWRQEGVNKFRKVVVSAVFSHRGETNSREWSLPHDDGNQTHYSFIEAVKELPQELALLLHVANYQAKAHGKDDQAEGVDPVHLTRHWDHFLPSELHDLLGAIGGVVQGVIHCHCHLEYSLPISGFELEHAGKMKRQLWWAHAFRHNSFIEKTLFIIIVVYSFSCETKKTTGEERRKCIFWLMKAVICERLWYIIWSDISQYNFKLCSFSPDFYPLSTLNCVSHLTCLFPLPAFFPAAILRLHSSNICH